MRAIAYVAIGLFCATAIGPRDAEAQRRGRTCAPAVQERLDQLQVDQGDISEIIYDPIYEYDADENRRMSNINAWVRFSSCKGALIVDMLPNCYVRQVYTRGECKVPGVKAF